MTQVDAGAEPRGDPKANFSRRAFCLSLLAGALPVSLGPTLFCACQNCGADASNGATVTDPASPTTDSVRVPALPSSNSPEGKAQSSRMPVVFVGHGSPMNAISDNEWSRGFRDLGAALPAAKAILAVSAHYYVPGTFLTGNETPKTIHDFGGFPRELFEVNYPARGSGDLAARVSELLTRWRAQVKHDWGLDHGTWSVLLHTHPLADVPVVQLSIDSRLSPQGHLAIGKQLAPLRDQGVLILASGNVTHNLGHALRSLNSGDRQKPTWADQFDLDIAKAVTGHDEAHLCNALDSEIGRLSHPYPDHYFPLLYAAGAAQGEELISFPISGFDLASLSMRAIRWG